MFMFILYNKSAHDTMGTFRDILNLYINNAKRDYNHFFYIYSLFYKLNVDLNENTMYLHLPL